MPLPIPTTNFDETPTTCIHINKLWIPILLGALQPYLNPPQWGIGQNVFMVNPEPVWDGDESANEDAEQQILKIMEALMLGNCEDVVMTIPSGTTVNYAGTAAPDGWLLCDGSSHLKATYPELWGVLSLSGAIFELDTDNFIVPDLRGRVVVGAGEGAGLTNRLIGQFDGEETHLLDIDEMPIHTHIQDAHNHDQDAHQHPITKRNGATGFGASTVASASVSGTTTTQNTQAATATNIATTATNQSAGGDEPHNNMQPYFVLNTIIKT